MRITENGSAVSRIVLGHCATWLETHGAEQLRDAIERISGAHLLITYEQDACPAGRPHSHRPPRPPTGKSAGTPGRRAFPGKP